MNWTVIEIKEKVDVIPEMYELAWCGIACNGGTGS